MGCFHKAVLLAGVAIGWAPMAQAQTKVQDEPSTDQEQVGATIIVTATKRPTGAQETPESISVYGDEYLRNSQVQEFSDLAASIPNLVVPDGATGATNIAIRGITSPSRAGTVAEQPVSAFIDGVFAPQGSLDQLIFDTRQIEVIRGPQGAIWGRNTLAGAISFVSERPTDELEGYASAAYGNYDLFELRGALSGPLVDDTLAARIAFAHDERDGFTERVAGGTTGTQDRWSVRGTVSVTPSDDLRIDLIGEYNKNTFFNATPEFFTGPLATAAGTDGFQRIADTDFYEPSSAEVYGATGLIEWNIGGLVLSSVTGLREVRLENNLDSDGTPEFIINELVTSRAEQLSQELRLSNAAHGKLGLRWMVGAEYYRRDDRLDVVSQLGPVLIGAAPGGGRALELAGFTNKVESIAGFATLDFDVSDLITMNAGARLSDESKTNSGSLGVILQLTGLPDATLLALERPERGLDDTQFSPYLGVTLHPSDDVLVYLSWGRGNKSGGFNDIRATQETFDAESANTYELGLKSTLLDGDVIFNSALFYIDYTDLQVRGFEGLVPIFVNAGEATSKGFETMLAYSPSDRFSLSANLGYLDAKFNRFIGPGGEDFSDNRLPLAQDWSVTLAGEVNQPVGDGEVFAFAEGSYSGDYFLDFANDRDGFQDAFLLLNARIGYRFKSGLSIAAFGRNLTDQDYRVDFQGDLPAGIFMGSKQQILGPPRTYGLEARFDF